MKYNKLVRDKIPEIIAESGKKVTFRILNDEEYKIELEKKLDEEVAEFHESKSIEELADILEVLIALRNAHGIDECAMMDARLAKNTKNGRFEKKIFLEEVEDGRR